MQRTKTLTKIFKPIIHFFIILFIFSLSIHQEKIDIVIEKSLEIQLLSYSITTQANVIMDTSTIKFNSVPFLFSSPSMLQLLDNQIKLLSPSLKVHNKGTITSQNVSSEAQIKNFFISKKNYVHFLKYSRICIFNHPMIYRL